MHQIVIVSAFGILSLLGPNICGSCWLLGWYYKITACSDSQDLSRSIKANVNRITMWIYIFFSMCIIIFLYHLTSLALKILTSFCCFSRKKKMKADYEYVYQQQSMLLSVNTLFPIRSPDFMMALINSKTPWRFRKELFGRKKKC